jgi:hypothetical protein
MSTAIPFPPRGAGPVLQQALEAAEAAGQAEATRLQRELFMQGGGRDYEGGLQARWAVEQAAVMAAMPGLRLLTSDGKMVDILAYGIATEVMSHLWKRWAV